MLRLKIAILFTILAQFAFKLAAQSLVDTTCIGEWRYYAATPDPNFQNSSFKWIFYGGVTNYVTKNNGREIKILWGSKPGKFKLGISEVSESGCIGDTTYAIIEVKGNLIDLPGVELCEGQPYSVQATGNFNSFEWKNDTLTSLTASNTFEGIATVTDTLYVKGIRDGECSNSTEAIIKVNPLPKINFKANGQPVTGPLTICGDDKVILETGSNALSYNWSTGEHSEFITLSTLPPLADADHQFFSVEATSEYGCVSSDSVKVLRCSVLDTIPGAFTPNGDGINDVWDVPYLKYFPNAIIDIYDRWGNSVYHSEHGYRKPWDGRVNGILLPTENYFYVIKLDKNSKPISGNVTVVH